MLPIDTDTREWIDARCSWILDQFGLDRILSSKVIAADAELLEGYRADNQDSVLALFRKICMTMDIEFKSIRFDFMRNDKQEEFNYGAGLYRSLGNGMHAITIDWDLLESPIELIATLAHELCHVLLIGHQRITGEEDDHEPLTDLLTVFLGFGALSGNSVLRDESWHEGNASRWQIRRSGYLTMPMYGYALAIYATLRKESSQDWKPRLRLDVRNAFQQSMKYFHNHGLPDLSKIIATQSRPRLHSQESISQEPPPKLKLRHGYYDDEDDVDAEFEEEYDYEYRDDHEEPEDVRKSEVRQCVYCGERAGRIYPQPLCTDCFVSIKENEKELKQERSEESLPKFVLWLYIMIGFFAGLLIISSVLRIVFNFFG